MENVEKIFLITAEELIENNFLSSDVEDIVLKLVEELSCNGKERVLELLKTRKE